MDSFVYIISEYNPFHNGHAYQIAEIRKRRPDAAVVCIMSGNFTQRGDVAIVNRFVRAKIVLAGGADLVLSLPFPWCCASAEYFADAGVSIADRLGPGELCFGSESGDIDELTEVASRLSELEADGFFTTARSRAAAYEKKYGQGSSHLLRGSNNILAIEYLRAIRRRGAALEPVTIKRIGAEYNNREVSLDNFASATAIRHLLYKKHYSLAEKQMPSGCAQILYSEINECGCASLENASLSLLGILRTMKSDDIKSIAEMGGGVGERIISSAMAAGSLEETLTLAATKQYTNSRLRRAIIYAATGVSPSTLKSEVAYTQILAANAKGLDALRVMKKEGRIEILTKPADHIKMSEVASRQYKLEADADKIYTLAYKKPMPANAFLRISPYIDA
ncbi:MAG: nucleotidyltransferase family protein [Eubacteriales bacterium]|nr:nucleotidyltransferase family protein [Clostridiales bacterium]